MAGHQIARLAFTSIIKQRFAKRLPAHSTRSFATFGEPTISQEENLEEHVADNKAASSRHVWWTPDPTTGVWIPQGQELHTHVSSTTSYNIASHAWFRDDVHGTPTSMVDH